jgi:imidazoleglycerol phosphate synthase glutamine amidotransferase subunit HisH
MLMGFINSYTCSDSCRHSTLLEESYHREVDSFVSHRKVPALQLHFQVDHGNTLSGPVLFTFNDQFKRAPTNDHH